MQQYGFKRGQGLRKTFGGITTYNTTSKNNPKSITQQIKKHKPLTAPKRRKLSERSKSIRDTFKPSTSPDYSFSTDSEEQNPHALPRSAAVGLLFKIVN
ncbi:hypothetical protein M0804_013369 [Polistes exclamans]|nr:hypothetical protein M0804_013369 [Polistes exclamans]